MSVICAIDPGNDGGVCFLASDKILSLEKMPGLSDLIVAFKTFAPRHVFLEKANTHPKDGRVGAFNYGRHNGQLEGILMGLGIPYTMIPPAVWSKMMHRGATGETTKARSLYVVTRLFPGLDLKATSRCRIPHSGKVDALLIAEYARRTYMAI